MSSDTRKRGCYCNERDNPKMRESFVDIPDGYCGICDVCGEYGHMMAHPRSPTTGSWCEKHYEELLSYKIFTLNYIVSIVFFVGISLLTAMVIYFTW